jgi:hypothetical protein
MKHKYRIVTDSYSGYEAQVKYWWFPFAWYQMGYTNTHASIEDAKRFIDRHGKTGKVVWESDKILLTQ